MAVTAAEQAAELIGTDAVRDRWDEPSALDGMTVGALAAHLHRATGAVIAYLDRSDPERRITDVAADDLLTKSTYFHAAVDSPVHERIKEVSATEAAAGHAELAAASRQLATDLAVRLPAESEERLIGALGGRVLTLDDFCRTRMIETLMHIDDLAHSVGLPTPAVDPAGTAEVIEIIVDIARHLHGDWAVIHALARAERAQPGVFPVF